MHQKRYSHRVSFSFTTLIMLFLVGCNTTPYSSNKAKILTNQYAKGNGTEAIKVIKNVHTPTGKNKLLYYLELGSIYQRTGQFIKSNQHLEKAKDLLESFYTTSISEQTLGILTGPTYTTYEGQMHYLPLIHSIKAMNYYEISKKQPDKRQAYLDSAIVEMKQLDVFLTSLSNQTGGYDNHISDDSVFNDVHRILQPISADQNLLENIDYKDDAFAHYLSGIFNEINQEYDSARLEYQRAIGAYEKGYAKQYKLPLSIVKPIYKSLIRVMSLSGGYRKEILSLKKKINHFEPNSLDTPILNLVQSVGITPQKKQFNLLLKADIASKALVLTPIPTGNYQERKAQMHWFQMLYADTSVFDMIQNYVMGDVTDVALGLLTKRIPLGPLWNDAQKIGLIRALEYGSRISVSYLLPMDSKIAKVELSINGKHQADLEPFNSIALLAVQNELINANAEIQASLAREIVKALSAQAIIDSTGLDANSLLGGFTKLATTVTNAITASADTRQWQLLPQQHRIAQVDVIYGQNDIVLKTFLKSGRVIEQRKKIDINAPISFLNTHTFLNSNSAQHSLN